MPRPNISVIFTCKGRSELTELCLRRFKELMPKPYELIVAYDGKNPFYENMLLKVGNPHTIIDGLDGGGRWDLLNDAISCASGPYYMHLENDFYWVDPTCLNDAVTAMEKYPIDFVRFEHLPFTISQFNRFEIVGNHDICWMKPETPYRFNWNPHIRKFKFPNSQLLQSSGFTKQPEQYHGKGYNGVSCCMTGDNFRHLGVFSEGGHLKTEYLQRFFNKRVVGKVNPERLMGILIEEINHVTDNALYRKLFYDYLIANGYSRYEYI